MTLPEMLARSVGLYGDNTAIIYDDHRQSYKELARYSDIIAGILIGLGICKGDRIALLLPNNLEYPSLLFGVVKAGAIAVPLDTKYKIYELSSIFRDCKPKALISCKQYIDPIKDKLADFGYIGHVLDIDQDPFGIQMHPGNLANDDSAFVSRIGPEDTCVISYTSGPTSSPKGVMLTHRNLVAESEISALGFQQTERDIAILFALPLHHVLGLVGVLMTAICKGSTVVIVPGLSLAGALATIEEKRATIFMGVPYIYRLMINMINKEGLHNDLRSLRLCGSCGAPLAKKTIAEFVKLLGFPLIDFYGLTEAGLHVTCPPVDGSGKTGSVGKALPGWEVKIVSGDGHYLPVNAEGEIAVRGVPVTKGYYNRPSETSEVLKDGWLHTGDIGKVDKDGYLFITGRKKDMIIRKGQNVYPADVEELLSQHPGIEEVAVVGIVDRLRGETLRAVVKPGDGVTLTEQEIKHYCLQHLASYKVPKQVVLTMTLPRNASGEILIDELRQPLADLKRIRQ